MKERTKTVMAKVSVAVLALNLKTLSPKRESGFQNPNPRRESGFGSIYSPIRQQARITTNKNIQSGGPAIERVRYLQAEVYDDNAMGTYEGSSQNKWSRWKEYMTEMRFAVYGECTEGFVFRGAANLAREMDCVFRNTRCDYTHDNMNITALDVVAINAQGQKMELKKGWHGVGKGEGK